MKSWVTCILCLGVIVDASPINTYPGIGAIYNGPNSETLVKRPYGSVLTREAQGAEVGLNLQSGPILVKEARPQNVLISEVRKEPILISEEVVSKVTGPNLIVGKIAQPLSVEGNTGTERNTNRNTELTSSSSRRPSDGVNGASYGGGYGVASIPKSRMGVLDEKNVPNVQDVPRPVIQEPGPLGDGHIYPPVVFDDPNIAALIPDGPVIVDEQIARDHLYIDDGPLYHPGTGALYEPRNAPIYRPGPAPGQLLPDRRLRPPVYEYARYAPTVVIRSDPILTTIPVSTILDTAPIYVAPRIIPGVAVAKDTVSTVSESRVDLLQPSPYLTPPAIKEPIIVNKW